MNNNYFLKIKRTFLKLWLNKPFRYTFILVVIGYIAYTVAYTSSNSYIGELLYNGF